MHTPPSSLKKRVWPWLAFSAVAGAAWWIGAAPYSSAQERPAGPPGQAQQRAGKGPEGGKRGGGPGGEKPVAVVAATAVTADMPIVLTGLGGVASRNSVTVRSRVSGQLTRVHFTEGQWVRAGELLAEIDPRPFQVQLTQAEGQMAKDQALLANARRDVERYKALALKSSVSAQQVDAQESLARQYEGAVLADQGAVDSARLQLSFTRITAPIAGRIGLRLIDAGNNIASTDAGGLAVINETQPITVVFSLPEDNAPLILKRLGEVQAKGGELPVEAWDRGSRRLLARGALLTADNQIDAASGTIKLKALFANADNSLLHNQFVNVRLLLDTRRGAVVVPGAAVQRGNAGAFVYAVGENQTVAVRRVVLGPAQGESVAVESGLSAGEVVVVSGADKLREGAKVELGAKETPPLAGGPGLGAEARPEKAAAPRSARPGG
jgi:multidrug efflux system membrane fusion protein